MLLIDLEDPRFFVSFQLLMDFMAINYKSVISTIVLHIINYEVMVHVIRFAFVKSGKRMATSLVLTLLVTTRAGSV